MVRNSSQRSVVSYYFCQNLLPWAPTLCINISFPFLFYFRFAYEHLNLKGTLKARITAKTSVILDLLKLKTVKMICGGMARRKVCEESRDLLENSPNLKGRSLLSPLKSLQLSPIPRALSGGVRKERKPMSLKGRG